VILFCAIGWLLSIAPVSQVFPLLHPRGERYLYVPALFAEVTLLWILWNLALRVPKTVMRWAVILSGIAVLASLALLSYSRALPWADERLLFSTALLEEPECAECWNNLAFAEAVRGNYEKAEIACRRGLAIDRRQFMGARDGFSLRYILIRSLLLQGKGHLATGWIWQIIRKGGPQPANLKLLLEAMGQAAASGRFHPGLLLYGN
jgi:tetratricopeptide (TPR) repeat protein